jgi:S-DNA-T family DNA segregation ATPase FtsK/SpoIIIE
VHVIAIDSDRSRLPEEATSVIEVDPEDRSLARVETQHRYYSRVLLDGTPLTTAESIARSLCSINHVSGAGDDALVPTRARLVDLLDLDLDSPESLVARWQRSPRGTSAIVGADAEGRFSIDIAAQGPHALVAGTTGSGKSEFLKSFVASLAIANRPDALNFVLVDYKGGSALADCVRLPHTVGLVTNLDARETERALVSLDAEIKHREAVITREFGVKDLDAAWAKDPEAAARAGLARLMIVIDEFAELKSELPEFIDGLVRIARVGRSLGLHLVLATQRPSGVVTPEMQSNISLRVALRVADRADSMDILGSVDAAMIGVATPGRAFMRAEAGGSPLPFQTGNVGGIRQGVQRTRKLPPVVAPVDWLSSGLPPRFPRTGGSSERRSQDDTDLRALVELVISATESMGIPQNRSPWLLPLPTSLRLSNVPVPRDASPTAVPLGLRDLPDRQAQEPLVWDYAHQSHVAFIGGARSGRTSALRTIVGRLIQSTSPDDLHVYALDFGGGGLMPILPAAHVGAVVSSLDADRLPRLMSRLMDELAHRQGVLSAGRFPSVIEQRAAAEPGARLPFIVVAIDAWERMIAVSSSEQTLLLRDQALRLLREGPAVGIRVIVSGDRTFPADKIAPHIDTQYVLPFRDINDYRSAGVMIKVVPEGIPSGRALIAPDGREVQLAVLDADATAEAQSAALAEIADSAEGLRITPGLEPFRVDAVPQSMALSTAVTLPLEPGNAEGGPVIAVGGDTVSRITLDWPDAAGFVVIGDRQSGKSSALAGIVRQLAWQRHPLFLVAPRPSILTRVATEFGLPVVTDPALMSAELDALLEPIAAQGIPTIVVDDAEVIKDSFVEQGLSAWRQRARFIVSADMQSIVRLHSGPFVAAKAGQSGIVFSPTISQQASAAFGANIPRPLLGKRAKGGGLLYRSGEYVQVQVPDPSV